MVGRLVHCRRGVSCLRSNRQVVLHRVAVDNGGERAALKKKSRQELLLHPINLLRSNVRQTGKKRRLQPCCSANRRITIKEALSHSITNVLHWANCALNADNLIVRMPLHCLGNHMTGSGCTLCINFPCQRELLSC